MMLETMTPLFFSIFGAIVDDIRKISRSWLGTQVSYAYSMYVLSTVSMVMSTRQRLCMFE